MGEVAPGIPSRRMRATASGGSITIVRSTNCEPGGCFVGPGRVSDVVGGGVTEVVGGPTVGSGGRRNERRPNATSPVAQMAATATSVHRTTGEASESGVGWGEGGDGLVRGADTVPGDEPAELTRGVSRAGADTAGRFDAELRVPVGTTGLRGRGPSDERSAAGSST